MDFIHKETAKPFSLRCKISNHFDAAGIYVTTLTFAPVTKSPIKFWKKSSFLACVLSPNWDQFTAVFNLIQIYILFLLIFFSFPFLSCFYSHFIFPYHCLLSSCHHFFLCKCRFIGEAQICV